MASFTARRRSSARTGASSKAAEAMATLAAAISALQEDYERVRVRMRVKVSDDEGEGECECKGGGEGG